MEIPCLALALYMYMILPLFWFLTGAIGSAIAMIVSANVAGKFCCYPSGNYRRLGSWLNAIFMLISFILSLPLLYLSRVLSASWCAARGATAERTSRPLRRDRRGRPSPSSPPCSTRHLLIASVLLLSCAGGPGVQAKQVQVVEVRTA